MSSKIPIVIPNYSKCFAASTFNSTYLSLANLLARLQHSTCTVHKLYLRRHRVRQPLLKTQIVLVARHHQVRLPNLNRSHMLKSRRRFLCEILPGVYKEHSRRGTEIAAGQVLRVFRPGTPPNLTYGMTWTDIPASSVAENLDSPQISTYRIDWADILAISAKNKSGGTGVSKDLGAESRNKCEGTAVSKASVAENLGSPPNSTNRIVLTDIPGILAAENLVSPPNSTNGVVLTDIPAISAAENKCRVKGFAAENRSKREI